MPKESQKQEVVTMVSAHDIEEQLKKVGCHYTLWGSSEVAELSKLVMDGEQIALAVNGYYEGGFGLLVATNYRVLIVDKKPFVLNLEDLRYEMITEVTYGARLFVASMRIAIPTRTIYFDSWSMEKLHKAMRYIQQHVLDARDNSVSAPMSDWFKSKASETEVRQMKQLKIAAKISKLVRSALIRMEDVAVPPPNGFSIGHRSSLRGINPYRRQGWGFQRRRLPMVYN